LDGPDIGIGMKDTVLVTSVGAYAPNLLVTSPYDFVFTKDEAVIKAWRGTVVLVGGCDLELLAWFSARNRMQRVVLIVVDMPNTLHTLAMMSKLGIAREYVAAINENRRDDIVKCIYEAIKPDVFVVNNSLMEADFVSAGTPATVVNCHGPGNGQLRLNIFDRFYGADRLPRTVQLGGLPKYIRTEVADYLKSLQEDGQIRLLRPNIEGGCVEEPTLIPPEAQIVVSCRAPRIADVHGVAINYATIERDWKPATKYLNSIFSGSHYIGTIEQSVWELSKNDELTLLLESIDDLPQAMNIALEFDPAERHLRAVRRRAAAMATNVSADHYCSVIARLC
jgi:hypothetical protein